MSNPTEELIAKISDQRFDGYTVTMLAEQIDQIRSGAGAGSFGAAVDALQSVATAFDETENTLREQLSVLGAAWSSDAAQQAMTVFADHAAFAEDTNTKLVATAEAGFALSEAFTRTLHRLPEAQTLRDGAGGLGFGDYLGSLVGYETDQAERVKAAQLAQTQAVDALNAYAHDTGTALQDIPSLLDPSAFVLGGTPPGQEETSTFGSIGSTLAAMAGQDPAPAVDRSAAAPLGGPRGGGTAQCEPSPAGFAAAPAPGQRTDSSGAPSARPEGGQGSTAPSSQQGAAPSSGAFGGGIVVGGGSTGGRATPRTGGRPADPGAPAPGDPAGGTGPTTKPGSTGSGPAAPGAAAGAARGPAEPGGRPGGAAGFSGSQGGAGVAGGGPGKAGLSGSPGAGTATEQPLARGKLTGAVPPPPATSGASGLGPGYGASPRPAVGNDLAAGAAALGAAAAAGGDANRERRGRGFGRGVQVDGRPLHEFPVGVADDEAEREATNVEFIEPDVGPEEPAFLQQAAPQDGDAPRVRSHGVDDVDLFADERMVAKDTIEGGPGSKRGGAAS